VGGDDGRHDDAREPDDDGEVGLVKPEALEGQGQREDRDRDDVEHEGERNEIPDDEERTVEPAVAEGELGDYGRAEAGGDVEITAFKSHDLRKEAGAVEHPEGDLDTDTDGVRQGEDARRAGGETLIKTTEAAHGREGQPNEGQQFPSKSDATERTPTMSVQRTQRTKRVATRIFYMRYRTALLEDVIKLRCCDLATS